MKTLYLILLLFGLIGCRPAPASRATLTAAEAGTLAQKLANEQARTLYQCQPFQESQPAQLVEGRWAWHNLRGQGRGDIEASVEFAVDGSRPSVILVRLDSRPILPAF